METAFLQDRLTKNPYQDSMGNDAHQGLERWLDKFHAPGVPSHTIITDPEYYIFLWFHNAVGNLINCPYASWESWEPKLKESTVNYSKTNSMLWGEEGIQSGTDFPWLPQNCIDLTPFVRQASLPEIKPANGDPIETLFGKTSAGSFSPYASDGQSSITLQMIDTEFCILDSLFYPWMKDINSPWWYRPDEVYTEWATPYPMATLEVQRPRMRYLEDPQIKESRNDAQYTYYSYKYIGVKPTNYSAFEINGGGVSNLLRSLTLSCDMCLVDLTGDVAGSSAGSTNLGVRSSFIFGESPNSGSGEQSDQEENPEATEPDANEELQEQQTQLAQWLEELNELLAEIQQQEEEDMPGEDEEEWMEKDDPEYNEDEYEDPYGEDEEQDVQDDFDEEDLYGDMDNDELEDDFDNSEWEDDSEAWEDDDSGETGDPNGDLSDYTMEEEAKDNESYGESDFTGEIQDDMMDVGSEQANDAASEQGWVADNAEVEGTDESMFDKAIGGAVDLVKSGMELVTDTISGGLDVATSENKTGFGIAGSLASAALEAFSPSSPQAQAQQAAQTPSNSFIGQMGDLFSNIGDTIGSVLGQTQTVFGTVANAISESTGSSTTLGGIFDKALSSVFPSSGNTIGNAGNIIGGTLAKLTDTASQSQIEGAVNQMIQAKKDVGNTSIMATTLNSAAVGISSSLNVVEDVAKSVLAATGASTQGSSTNDFGTLINRMTTSTGAKPTPIEEFASMVTKHNVVGSIKA